MSTMIDASRTHHLQKKKSILRLSEKLQLGKKATTARRQQRQPEEEEEEEEEIKIFGHRGALFEGIENTLAAFRSCCQMAGCDGVELDVFRLKDDNLVVFHGTGGDETPGLLQDYCDAEGGGSILDLTLAEVQQLTFVSDSPHLMAPPSPAFASEAYIPTLQEVLELFQLYPNKRVTIELKGEGTVQPAIRLVQEMQMTQQVTFSSFHLGRVKLVKEIDFSLRTGAIFKGEVPPQFLLKAKEVQADEIHLRYDTCTVDRVTAAHQKGFRVMAWFRGPKAMNQDLDRYVDIANNEITVYKMVLQTGVDAICCNRPRCAVALVSKRKRNQ